MTRCRLRTTTLSSDGTTGTTNGKASSLDVGGSGAALGGRFASLDTRGRIGGLVCPHTSFGPVDSPSYAYRGRVQ